MLEIALASLALAFGVSVALNIYLSVVAGRLKRDRDDRDDLIDDLRNAIGGHNPAGDEAWRKAVL